MGKEQHRHDISDRAWEKIRPYTIGEKGTRGGNARDTQIDVKKIENKCVVYAAVFGGELQDSIVFSQQGRYNGKKAIGLGLFLLAPARKGGTGYENQLQAAVENTD